MPAPLKPVCIRIIVKQRPVDKPSVINLLTDVAKFLYVVGRQSRHLSKPPFQSVTTVSTGS
jgi:hypothetical protein